MPRGLDLTYRSVVAAGEYDTGTEVLVFRALDGVSGYHVLTPLRMADGTAIVVDRGWVPLEYDHPPVAPARPMEGSLLVTGRHLAVGDRATSPRRCPRS